VIEEILFTKKTPTSTTNQKIGKSHFFFCPALIDAECDFIGQLNRRKGPFFGLGNI